METQTLINRRNDLIQAIATKVCETYVFNTQLPNIEVEGVYVFSFGIRLKMPRWYDAHDYTPKDLVRMWTKNRYTPDQIQEDINAIAKYHHLWNQELLNWNEVSELEQILESI